MSIHEFQKPIPVTITESSLSNKEGYALYVESSGMYENDIWTIVMKDDGTIVHVTSKQIKISPNDTFAINKKR